MLHVCSRSEIALSMFSKKEVRNDFIMSVVIKTLRLIIDIVSSNKLFFMFLNFWTLKARNSFNDESENVASRKKYDFRYRWILEQHDVVMMSSDMINWIYFSQFLIHFMNNLSLIHNVFHRIFKRRIVIRIQLQLKNRLHILFRQRIRNVKSSVHEFFKIDVDFVIQIFIQNVFNIMFSRIFEKKEFDVDVDFRAQRNVFLTFLSKTKTAKKRELHYRLIKSFMTNFSHFVFSRF